VSAPEAVRRTVQWHLDNREMLESMVEEEKEGKPRRDPYAYDLEDRLVALHKEYARSVSAAIPSLGRRRG
jgi:hypothetical protein